MTRPTQSKPSPAGGAKAPVATPAAHVLVGIDFGTSLTKVCYRVLGPNPEVKPLLFPAEEPEPKRTWNIPTLILVEDGKLLLGHVAAEAAGIGRPREGFRHLKMLLAGEHSAEFRNEASHAAADAYAREALGAERAPVAELCALFLATVMRWSSELVAEQVDEGRLEFVFNVCMPIQFERDAEVKTAFERVLALAQELFQTRTGALRRRMDAGILADLRARLAAPDLRYDANAESTMVFLAEESQAQIASYVDSAALSDRVHCLIDFGAGTTDVTLLWLTPDYQQKRGRYLLASRNIPAGFANVEPLLVDSLKEIRRSDLVPHARLMLRHLGWTPEKPFLQQLGAWGLTLEQIGPALEELDRVAGDIYENSRALWANAYNKLLVELGKDTLNQAYWDASMNHRNPPVILVCGGAATNRNVRNRFIVSPLSAQRGRQWGKYSVEELPHPPAHRWSSRWVERAPFGRMAVAYGLVTGTFCEEFTSAPIGPRMVRYHDFRENQPGRFAG